MNRALLVAGIGTIALYAVLLFALWRYQERIVFQPPSKAGPGAVDARKMWYTASDGVRLFAYVVGDCTTETVVVAFHGNAELARWLVPWARIVSRETGACVVLPEFRGYDGLDGPPTYAASALDAQAALGLVRHELTLSSSRTVYFGHSLGTAIAAELAAFEEPASLVLEAPFSSARAMGARMIVPGVAAFWRIISRVHFDTVERVGRLSCPVWVSHGDRDLIIPVRMGREVFAAARREGELLIVEGAGHNDVADVGGSDYWRWLRAAIGVSETIRPTRDVPTGT